MKKIFLFLSFFPCFLFGQITTLNFSDYQAYSNFTVRAYRYSTNGSTTYTSFSSPYDLITSNLMRMQCGFEITANDPHFLSFTAGNNPLQSATVDSNIYFISGNDGYRYTIMLIPHLHTLFSTLAFYILENRHLFKSVSTSYPNYYNVYPFQVVQQIVSGTNDFYKSSVLSSLSALNTSLSSIDNSLLSILSNVQDLRNSIGGKSYTWEQVSNNFVSLVPSFIGNGLDTNYSKVLQELDPSRWDLSDPLQQQEFQALVDSYGRAIDSLSNISGLANVLADPSSPSGVGNGLSQLGNVINSSVDASVNDFKRLSTNWQEGVKKDLQDWRNDVTNRLAHMFDENVPIDGGNSTPVYVSGQNGGPVSVAGVVRIDQQIPVGVTISAPITIDPTQFNQFSSGWESIVQAVTDFHDYFTSWASNGDIGFGWVRYYSMMFDFSQNTLTNQLAQISLLSSLTNLFANYADNFTNNVIFSISNALAGLSSVSNDYMLLSDYANYINSHGLVDLIDVMDDDTYSALKDELFGISSLDQADSYGRWWRYFTGLQTINANSNYKLANLFIGHENTLKDLKDSSGSDSLLDKFQQLFELIPSPTDIMDKTGNMTNSIDRSGFASLVDQSSSMSNYFNRVEMFFNRGSSLPANISINLGFGNKPGLQESQPIVLPLDKYRGVMDLLHYGIAFSYCIVNLILLPKFLLILIHLFDRVWKGYDKKLSDAVQA